MNLETVISVCARFIDDVETRGILDSLQKIIALMDGCTDVSDIRAKAASITKTLGALEETLEDSLFSSQPLKTFPDFDPLGLANIWQGKTLDLIHTALDDDALSPDTLRKLKASLKMQSSALTQAAAEVRKMLGATEFFGISAREPSDQIMNGDTLAIIQMPASESGEPQSFETFMERLQAFQVLLDLCAALPVDGESAESEEILASNIKMVAGRDPMVVADLSSASGIILTTLLDAVEGIKVRISELDASRVKLEELDIDLTIISALNEESVRVRTLTSKPETEFLEQFAAGPTRDTVREVCSRLVKLMEEGVRFNAVSINEEMSSQPAAENITTSTKAPQLTLVQKPNVDEAPADKTPATDVTKPQEGSGLEETAYTPPIIRAETASEEAMETIKAAIVAKTGLSSAEELTNNTSSNELASEDTNDIAEEEANVTVETDTATKNEVDVKPEIEVRTDTDTDTDTENNELDEIITDEVKEPTASTAINYDNTAEISPAIETNEKLAPEQAVDENLAKPSITMSSLSLAAKRSLENTKVDASDKGADIKEEAEAKAEVFTGKNAELRKTITGKQTPVIREENKDRADGNDDQDQRKKTFRSIWDAMSRRGP